MYFDPVSCLLSVYVYACEDECFEDAGLDDQLAEALELLFTYRLKVKPLSDSLVLELSLRPFSTQFPKSPSYFLASKIDSLLDWLWFAIEGEERTRKRQAALPEIASPPRFDKSQLLGMKNVVREWVERNSFDFDVLSSAINTEIVLRNTTERSSVLPAQQTKSVNKPGRKPGKVKLSKCELEAIRLYKEGSKPAAIDSVILARNDAKRGVGKNATDWKYGTTEKVIRAAKGRGDIA